MRIITAQELERWQAGGRVLEQDSRGPKVIQLSDGQILKIFRPRHRFWLERFYPQAQRFASNASKLQQHNIQTPTIKQCLWIEKKTAISACLYEPLPGVSLEQIYKKDPARCALLIPDLGSFISNLHKKGIYFRSLHLGNILLTSEKNFGLIDFLDIKFKNHPLSKRLKKRNIAHLSAYLKRRKLDNFPLPSLIQTLELD